MTERDPMFFFFCLFFSINKRGEDMCRDFFFLRTFMQILYERVPVNYILTRDPAWYDRIIRYVSV